MQGMSGKKLIKYDLRISMSAFLVTDTTIPWGAVDLISVPSYKSGGPWVLFDPEHIGKEITGHTLPSHSGNAVVWGAKAYESNQDIADGSGTSPCSFQECPNCRSLNPEGFTCCLQCYVPGHALHEKGLQRQIGAGTLVSSQERRALFVPLINRG